MGAVVCRFFGYHGKKIGRNCREEWWRGIIVKRGQD